MWYFMFSNTKYLEMQGWCGWKNVFYSSSRRACWSCWFCRRSAGGPTYGYELIAQLGNRSGGLFTLREGTLYPILYRLEDDGLIEAVWQQETGACGSAEDLFRDGKGQRRK